MAHLFAHVQYTQHALSSDLPLVAGLPHVQGILLLAVHAPRFRAHSESEFHTALLRQK